ncbi:peptidoglycan-binding domain-containing protein [Streptomyces sp. NPDC001980]|uniref:peptidoglycan-binding domain-containing protein n=1 Tax=Streptomyces sp. NPDC001980 TaxID=3157126 RepID=UPI003325EA79
MIRNTTGTRTKKAHAKLTCLVTAGVLGASLVALAPAASAAVPTAVATTYTCHPSWKASGGLYYLYEGYSDTNTTNTKKGQTGSRVIEVQCLLTYWANRVGESKYDPKGIDGQFGSNTEAAVINAQKACFSDSSEWDGEVGPNTWPCLRVWATT